jgi:integrase
MPGSVLEFKPRIDENPVVETAKCPHCFGEIPAAARFCMHCGNKVKAEKKSKKSAPKSKHTKAPLKTDEEINAFAQAISTPTSNSEHKRTIALRNLALFLVGINTGLRNSDLLRLKVSHFFNKDMSARKTLYVVEKKTGKGREIDIMPQLAEHVKEYVESAGLGYEDFLAGSQRGRTSSVRDDDLHGENVLSGISWNQIIVSTAESLGWQASKYGGHTLRKTFGYRTYKSASALSRESGSLALATVCKMFNHSSEAITLIYIGLDKEEVMEVCKLTTDQYDWAAMQAMAYELGDKNEEN